MEMRSKSLLVSFLAIASILLLVATVSATEIIRANTDSVEVDGINIVETDIHTGISVDAGELVTVKVKFTANVNDQDVTVEAELEGDKVDANAVTESFDVESGKRYSKTLTIRVPYELKDQLSDYITLNIKIDGKDAKTELSPEITLRVQRTSYNADIKSIVAPQSVSAGDTFPVDIVLKNIGYNDLDDVYVSASIPALSVGTSAYFGDIVAIECSNDDLDTREEREDVYGVDIDRKCNEDDSDTANGRLFLKVPYEAKDGIYTVEVAVKNDDTTSNEVVQIVVQNEFTSNVIVSSPRKTVAVDEDAKYSLLIVNPTDKLKVYRVVTESSGELSSNAEEAVVAVPAGSSKTVNIIANAGAEGEYNFNVNVFAGEKLVDTVSLTAKVEGAKNAVAGSPVVILTVVLAIIFIVLLIVLIILIGKKPEKAEEFGESYY